MKDICDRNDLEILMRAFYQKALINPDISSFFTQIAKIDLEEHLPHIVDFWEFQLFRKGDYKKNVLLQNTSNPITNGEEVHVVCWTDFRRPWWGCGSFVGFGFEQA